ncbi:MAG TPA: glycosyltransferase family 39 protein [Solirubrobacteraceae bacterium]|jgi:hypothetical protein|nr:glycosyltransferase family 39 protein [Solirubrobacteraceae bacterium]
MATAESSAPRKSRRRRLRRGRSAGPGAADGARRWAWAGLALVLLGGLALRLWGIRQGLPFAYNADEADHFVPHAVQMFEEGTLNPHYFANPPGFTYVLHFLLEVSYGGAAAVLHAYRTDPEAVYTLARVAGAVLGTLALWLLYGAGARLFGRAVGLLAAAIEAVAFLPVFYAHLALNDVPTLAPLTLSLLGSAGVLRHGRVRDHVLAGIGLGLACATKYTAGIVLLPYLVAAGGRLLDGPAGRERRRTLAGAAAMAVCAIGAFAIANPYSLLDYSAFHRELVHQSTLSAEAQGKLGAPNQGGLVYYLWSLTWGLGWVPALAALAGAVLLALRDRRAALMLVPAAVAYLLFMGTEGRYFGRWLMPILPILCLLAAFAAREAVTAVRRRAGPRATVAVAALLVAALLAQGLYYSVHSGQVLSRADTRTQTRDWMVANVPRGAKVVVEPVSPDQWAREAPGSSAGCAGTRYRWCKWPSLYTFIDAGGALDVAHRHEVSIEDYVRTLAPSLIGLYEQRGYCWVVTGSTEQGRALADPRAVPLAIAYYRALAAQGEVVRRFSPYAAGQGPVAFNFDWSFDYYPRAYARPGPLMTVYRLHGGRCATPGA